MLTTFVPPTDAALLAVPGRSVFDPETGAWRRDPGAATQVGCTGPMLARTFGEVAIRLPLLAQPKIDGVRALLGRSGLVTREGTRILSLPEIAALGDHLPEGVTLDGELDLCGGTLEDIAAVVQTKAPHPRRHLVTLHVFDAIFAGGDALGLDRATPCRRRIEAAAAWAAALGDVSTCAVVPVPTIEVASVEAMDDHYRACLAAGFEGQILRDPDASYVHGRTAALIKRKPWNDAEGAFVRLVAGKRTGLPRACIVRDAETAEEITVAIPAMSAEERRRLAANPPPVGSLVGWRWQASHSAHRRHCTLVRFYGPEGRF